MTDVMKIHFNSDGIGTLAYKGASYAIGGQVGRAYPKDITVLPSAKSLSHMSGEYGCELKYAILIWGQKGIYIHEWGTLAGSAGCLHLMPGDAEAVYNAFTSKTRILIDYDW